MDLLKKTREINRLIQTAAGEPVDFNEIAEVLSRAVESNVYVVSRKGKLLGSRHLASHDASFVVEESLDEEGFIPEECNNWLLDFEETAANLKDDMCTFLVVEGDEHNLTVVPVTGGGQRLGTLILVRFDTIFGDQEMILAEYAATVIAVEIMRSESESTEEEARKRAQVQVALNTLSYSEMEAVEHILAELDGDEGLLVASDIADRIGITRSVFVNALRKFESAGVLESRSLGRKGTYVRIINDKLFEEMEKMN